MVLITLNQAILPAFILYNLALPRSHRVAPTFLEIDFVLRI